MDIEDIITLTSAGVLGAAFVSGIVKNLSSESRLSRFRSNHPIDEVKREMNNYLKEHPETEKAEMSQRALELISEAENSHYHTDAKEKIDTAYKIYQEQF